MSSPIFFETFEQRRLLTAALEGTTLHITGYSKPDQISVEIDQSDPGKLKVTVDGANKLFRRKDVASIRIEGRGGNDDIEVRQEHADLTLPTVIFGGEGDDTIVGGAGKDVLHGEA